MHCGVDYTRLNWTEINEDRQVASVIMKGPGKKKWVNSMEDDNDGELGKREME